MSWYVFRFSHQHSSKLYSCFACAVFRLPDIPVGTFPKSINFTHSSDKTAHQKHLERRSPVRKQKTLVTYQVFVFFTRKQQLVAPYYREGWSAWVFLSKCHPALAKLLALEHLSSLLFLLLWHLSALARCFHRHYKVADW